MNSEIAPFLPNDVFRGSEPRLSEPYFTMRFSSTPRGARLARRLASHLLDGWGVPYDSDAHHAMTLIVGELAANAVRHGRVPGRDFHLAVTRHATTVWIEVTDTRGECVPTVATPTEAGCTGDTGRGLLLVAHLAVRWGRHPRADGPGKTVWAEYVLPAGRLSAYAFPRNRDQGVQRALVWCRPTGSASWHYGGMERVLGIGGYFMRAAEPAALSTWYRECLGLDADENGLWRQGDGPTVFATFESETDYFGSRAQQTMLNFRVNDLDTMLAQLRAKGADVSDETQDMDGVGRFGWVTDPEGNRVELWQPA